MKRTMLRQRNRRMFRPELTTLEPRVVMDGSGGLPPLGLPFGGGVGYSFTNWPVGQLADFELSAENLFPIVGPKGQAIHAPEDWYIRDPFPVTDLDGNLAQIGGWYMVAGLAAPRGQTTLNEYSYLISRDGVNWKEGGTLIATGQEGIVGDQLFSGDLRYDAANNRMLIYYTAVEGLTTNDFVEAPSGRNMRQEIAVSEAVAVPTETGLTFTSFTHYGIELVPDGAWYAKPEDANTETEVYGFRDPWLFRDPESGRNFLLFVGNWGTDQTIGYPAGATTGDQAFPDAGPHTVDPTKPRNDGVVGIAVATDATLTNWELLPPIFGAISVNTQLELPHFVYEDGRYYLFTTTHDRTFIGDLKYEYPEGLYGFVADDLQGPYAPVNGTSLVLANPPQDPLQNYAWKVIPTGDNQAQVISFINKGGSGTISPSVRLKIDGDRVTLDGFQPPSGFPQVAVPGIPLMFGISDTLPSTSTLPILTGSLDAASDSGGSNSDGITNDNTPTFRGTGAAGQTVRLLVRPEGTTISLLIGQTTAAADGTWAITATTLPDGTHTFFATSEGQVGAPVLRSELGAATIDTAGPEFQGVTVDRRRGRIFLNVSDTGAGLDGSSLDNPDAYRLTRGTGRWQRRYRITDVDGLTTPEQVTLTANGGHRFLPGRYQLNVGDGMIRDLAGNSSDSYTTHWAVNYQGVSQPTVVPEPTQLSLRRPNVKRPFQVRAARLSLR